MRSRWPRNAKLLDVLLDKGLDAPFSCREGHCGACAVLKKSGDVEMEVNDVLEQSDLDEGLILGCQARAEVRFGRSHLRRIAAGLPFAAPEGAHMKRLATAGAAALVTVVLVHPASATAASNTAVTSIPADPANTIEMHVTANCSSRRTGARSTPRPTC